MVGPKTLALRARVREVMFRFPPDTPSHVMAKAVEEELGFEERRALLLVIYAKESPEWRAWASGQAERGLVQ
jgi:hypothetical protein